MSSKDGEQLPEASDSSSHSNNEPPKAQDALPVKPKTISCTQCRKRKLKCDRGKPTCSTCSRLQHSCVYPEGRMKPTTKRRNVKDLEARLAQVETLLNSEGAPGWSTAELPIGSKKPESNPATATRNYWDDLDVDVPMANDMNEETSQGSSGFPLSAPIEDKFIPNELIGFGLQENLPSRETIDELHDLFFTRVHPSSPTVQKYKYLANVNLLPPLGPPICLRYALWANAASTSEKYSKHGEVFYQRARKYAEIDETKGQEASFVTISHAQCWALISNYEAQTMYMSRAWLSAGKAIRLVQMMNLHHIDGGGENVKQLLPPTRDWTELEERRRTFWTTFCCDRYACAGTGWPMSIDEADITTHLPSSEEAYENGYEEVTTSLPAAMTSEGVARISPYGAVVLLACLFGHNWLHLHRPSPNDNPGDFVEGEFWKRHRKMDNVLSNTFMFLPPRLKLPAGLRLPLIVYVNMNIHASIICLHQAAILKAERHGLDQRIIRQSQARCRAAAQEIVTIMRLISHFDVSELNAWVSFNLYIATGVLIEGCHSPETSQESRSNLEFLLTALHHIGRKHIITQAFIAQLKIDLEIAGIISPFGKMDLQDTVEPLITSIDVRHIKNRVVDISDIFNPSLPSTGISPPANGSSESCSTSDKDSTTPPLIQDVAALLGVLPKQAMAERLRRATRFDPYSFNTQYEKSKSSDVPKFFNIPTLLSQYSIPKEQEALPSLDQQFDVFSTQLAGDQSSLTSAFGYEQQFMHSDNNGVFMDQRSSGFSDGTISDAVPPDWAFGPIDNSAIPGFPGNGYSAEERQQINSLLNGASWESSNF